MEYSDLGVAIQRSKGIPVIQADARNLPFEDDSFDVVICLDVLEHILEDEQVAAEIHRVLRKNGKFLISVPEDPMLWSNHDVVVNHIRRYTKSSLIELIANSELKIGAVWSTLVLLRPAIKLARKFQKGSSLSLLNPFLNRLLYLICRIEMLLPIRRFQGVTLWIEGTKS